MILRMMPGGGTTDFDALTAEAGDVLEEKTFIGSGDDEEQAGTLINRANMHGAPGYSASRPTVPVHQSVLADTTVDTNGDVQIVLSPPDGAYPGDDSAYVGCYPAEIGILPGVIANGQEAGGVAGTYGFDATAKNGDVRSGKVFYDKDGRQIGDAADYAAAAVTLNAGERHTIQKGFHQEGNVTAASLASQTQPKSGDTAASPDVILEGFGAWSNGVYRDGSMKNITDDATITYTSSNDTKVVEGDFASIKTNSDNVDRFMIRYHNTPGFIRSNTLFGVVLRTLRDAIGLTAAKIANGQVVAKMTGTYGSDATATADQIVKTRTAYGKNGKITGTLPDEQNGKQAKSVSMASGQLRFVIPETGRYILDRYIFMPLASVATAIGLTAAKLANGQTAGGVTGTYGSDSTATAEKILNGWTAYGPNGKITGNIQNQNATTLYATGSAQSAAVAKGKYLAGDIAVAALTATNFAAANIKNGIQVKVNNGNTDVFTATGTCKARKNVVFSAVSTAASSVALRLEGHSSDNNYRYIEISAADLRSAGIVPESVMMIGGHNAWYCAAYGSNGGFNIMDGDNHNSSGYGRSSDGNNSGKFYCNATNGIKLPVCDSSWSLTDAPTWYVMVFGYET